MTCWPRDYYCMWITRLHIPADLLIPHTLGFIEFKSNTQIWIHGPLWPLNHLLLNQKISPKIYKLINSYWSVIVMMLCSVHVNSAILPHILIYLFHFSCQGGVLFCFSSPCHIMCIWFRAIQIKMWFHVIWLPQVKGDETIMVWLSIYAHHSHILTMELQKMHTHKAKLNCSAWWKQSFRDGYSILTIYPWTTSSKTNMFHGKAGVFTSSIPNKDVGCWSLSQRTIGKMHKIKCIIQH